MAIIRIFPLSCCVKCSSRTVRCRALVSKPAPPFPLCLHGEGGGQGGFSPSTLKSELNLTICLEFAKSLWNISMTLIHVAVDCHSNKSKKYILRTIKKSKTSAQWTAQLLWIVAIIFDLLFLEGIFPLQVPLVMQSLYSRQWCASIVWRRKKRGIKALPSPYCNVWPTN